MPHKSDYRMHAHINPFQDLNIPYPLNPSYVDWSLHYPIKPYTDVLPIVVNTNKYPEPTNYNL